MQKTSVYLPEHLKRALAARAAATGRSEAAVLRAAVESEVAGRTAEPATNGAVVEAPVAGRLVGIGVGPGDPDLLTLRAVTALRRASRVVAPTTGTEVVGRAEAIVRAVAPEIRVTRLRFEMAPVQKARRAALDDAAAAIVAMLDAGEEVAFITLGDPLTFSTFTAAAERVLALRPSTTTAVVPGVMAFQALAARTGTLLADEREAICIRTALDGDDLTSELEHADRTVVLYKGGRRLPELAAAAAAAGRNGSAVAGELMGMIGERIGPLDELASGPTSYLTTVIVPARRTAAKAATKSRAAKANQHTRAK